MHRLFDRTLRFAVAVTVVAAIPAAALAECCVVPDNGFGTATLPPQSTVASTCMYLGNTEITDGLPAGATIQIAASIGNFTNVTEWPGGSLSGTASAWEGQCVMQMTGTGALSGFNRSITVPLTGYWNNLFIFAPRTAFAPVQTAAALLNSLNGQIVNVGDPDFDLLRIIGGYNNGMPSPGQIQLVSTGSSWAVSGYFDITHSIEYIGAPGGALAGMSGGNTQQRRFEICPENAVAVEGASWSRTKALYR